MVSVPRSVVVGAVIVDDLARPSFVVAARRTRPADLAGRWEFPGGKVEAGETPQEALVREVREELGVEIAVGPELESGADGWSISERHVLRLFLAVVTAGELLGRADHDELRQLGSDELRSVDWLPSDQEALPAVARALEEQPT